MYWVIHAVVTLFSSLIRQTMKKLAIDITLKPMYVECKYKVEIEGRFKKDTRTIFVCFRWPMNNWIDLTWVIDQTSQT